MNRGKTLFVYFVASRSRLGPKNVSAQTDKYIISCIVKTYCIAIEGMWSKSFTKIMLEHATFGKSSSESKILFYG